jgi:hypothetical protein
MKNTVRIDILDKNYDVNINRTKSCIEITTIKPIQLKKNMMILLPLRVYVKPNQTLHFKHDNFDVRFMNKSIGEENEVIMFLSPNFILNSELDIQVYLTEVIPITHLQVQTALYEEDYSTE